MTAVLPVLSAALSLTALPALPEQGLALDTKAGVQLQTMHGRPLANIPRLDLASDKKTARALLLRDRRGRLFALDLYERRVRRVYEKPSTVPGCRLTDTQLYVCRQTLRRAGRVVARAPRKIGHWVWAELAPGGDAILAQWSAECEVPVAYVVRRGVLHAYGSGTVALGWLRNGDAIIHFPQGGGCGRSYVPGIYTVRPTGKRRLLLRTGRLAQYGMWGG